MSEYRRWQLRGLHHYVIPLLTRDPTVYRGMLDAPLQKQTAQNDLRYGWLGEPDESMNQHMRLYIQPVPKYITQRGHSV
jgi:hypothetical protein